MDGYLARMHSRGKSLTWIAKVLAMPRASCLARAMALGVIKRRAGARRVVDAAEPLPVGALRDVLDDGVCHWVAGCVATRAWRMCGHPSVHGTLWCVHHLARVRPVAGAKVRDGG